MQSTLSKGRSLFIYVKILFFKQIMIICMTFVHPPFDAMRQIQIGILQKS